MVLSGLTKLGAQTQALIEDRLKLLTWHSLSQKEQPLFLN